MISELLSSQEFQRLEKEYKFLSRAREKINELETLPYVFLDTETTGLEPDKSEVIEIAAIKVENKEIKKVFNSLIKPLYPIPGHITKVNGINNDMVADHPKFKEVFGKFMEIIKPEDILVAHNAEFDMGFLNLHGKVKIPNQVICTVKASRFALPNLSSHKLSSVAQYFGVPTPHLHRALADVEILYQLWFKLLDKLRDKNIFTREDLQKLPK